MDKPPEHILCQAEVLLQNKHYSEALSLLRSLELAQLQPEARAVFCLLVTEAGLFAGDYSFDVIDEAIEAFRFSGSAGQFAKAKYLKGWRLVALGRHFEAQEPLLESYAGYLRCKDFICAARPLNFLAYAQMQCGETEAATRNLERCLEIYEAAGEKGAAAIRRMNLASLLCQTGKLRHSQRQFDSVETEIVQQGAKNCAIYYIESSLVRTLTGDAVNAGRRLGKAKRYLSGCMRETALHYEKLGLLLLLQARFKDGLVALRKGLSIALQLAPESALVSQIKRLFGDLYIATRKYDLAEKYATEALAVAEKIGQKLEIAACWRVFAQVEAHRANREQAKDWFKKALEMFTMISARYELAVTRYLAACSGLYDQAERLALLHLAKEYFDSEEVAPYIEKTQAELAKFTTARPSPVLAPKNQIITSDKAMLRILEMARHVAPSSMTVLLTGETGTGKDLLATYLHECSGRTGRFVSQNFGALPVTLAEAELFGYHKGAFTGADHDRPGLFEEADGGTFFFNEIGEAPMEIQAKLLEVLSTRTIRRLGDTKDRPVNVRVIAATNQDLQQAIRENRFRIDLYHRLNEISMHLPPLAERVGDIPLLVAHFLGVLGVNLADDGSRPEVERLASILEAQAWPGNVRELRAEIARLHLMANGDLNRMVELAAESTTFTEEERLERLLEQTGWNQSRVAQILGISEAAIRKRMRKFGLVRG